ncbi:MAG: glycosyltransferase [Pseudomonadota bacterium]
MAPVISIITPTYNRSRVLGRAIESVLSQTVDDFEYIVVDDASTDDTADLVRSFNDKRIRFIQLEKNSGANRARNTGINAASAPTLAFLDSDDVFQPDRLANTLDAFAKNPKVNLVINSFVSVSKARQSDCTNLEAILSPALLWQALVTYNLFISSSAINVRRQTALDVGGFSEGLNRMQDRDFLLKLASHHGALTVAQIDWIKYESDDSISASHRGYVRALAELMALNPTVAAKERATVRYHVLRRMLKLLARRRIDIALSELLESRLHEDTRIPFHAMIASYKGGKQRRRAVRQALIRAARDYADKHLREDQTP